MFKRILLATDGSEHAKKAFDFAVQLAKHHHAELILVHAYGPVPALVGTPFYYTLLEPHLVEGENLLHHLIAEGEAAGVSTYHNLHHGPASEAILNFAKDEECDLIVMGALGTGESGCLELGSTSHEVLCNAACPVVIVR